MRRFLPFRILLFLLVAGFGACSPAKKLTAPAATVMVADSLPALPQSEIDLPIKVAGRPLLLAGDSVFPREFLSPGWPSYLQPSCDFRYKYRFVRSGFIVRCTNNRISVAHGRELPGGRREMPLRPWQTRQSLGFGLLRL